MDNKIITRGILCTVSMGIVIQLNTLEVVQANSFLQDETTHNKIDDIDNIIKQFANVENRLAYLSKDSSTYKNDLINNVVSIEVIQSFNKNTKLDKKSKFELTENEDVELDILEKEENKEKISFKNDELILEDNEEIEQEDYAINIDNKRININPIKNDIDIDKLDDTSLNKQEKCFETVDNHKCDFDIEENFLTLTENKKYIPLKDVKETVIIKENKENVILSNDDNIMSLKQEKLSLEDRKSIKEQAVLKARAGLYKEALSSLKLLYKDDANDLELIYDYMTVLNWAGEYKKAIAIYEGSKFNDMPKYVCTNIAGSYYRLGLFDEAIEILKPFILAEDKEALMFLGQIYLKAGRINQADEVYDKLTNKYSDDLNIYIEKADITTSLGDWQTTAKIWEKVLNLYEQNNNYSIDKMMIIDKLATSYIRLARYKEAENLLKPFIKNETALNNMIGNYLIILNQTNRFKFVPLNFYKFFTNYENVPIFIIRELANSYIKMKKYEKAIDLYKFLVDRATDDDIEDKFNLAYYSCLANKNISLGFLQYADILQRENANLFTTRILNQAQDLLKKGKYKSAKGIYYELIKYDERFHNIYAGDLLSEGQYQSAWKEYTEMLGSEKLHDKAVEGIIKTAIKLKDYKTAETLIKNLKHTYQEELEYEKGSGSFTNRQKGEVYFNVYNYSDYDDSDEYDINLYFNQYVNDGFWLEGQWGKAFIKDVESSKHSILNTNRLGTRYIGRKVNTLVALNMFNFKAENNLGLYIESLFTPDDRQSVFFSYNFEPIHNADVLELGKNAIFGKNYVIRYMYNLNPLEEYYIELAKTDFDDGNNKYAWEFGQNLRSYENKLKGESLTRNLHWGQERYSNQNVIYNSPKLDENIGTEWILAKQLNHDDNINYTLGINWGREYPDNFALNPYMKVEYDKAIDNYRYFTIGFSYGLRTEGIFGQGDWQYDNKQLYMSYNLTW